MNELIELSQANMFAITLQFQAINETIEKQLSGIEAYTATEENKKLLKELRANFRAEAAELKELAKVSKEGVSAMIRDFDNLFKECIKEPYEAADKMLKEKIDAIEKIQIDAYREELENYLLKALSVYEQIDFVTLADMPIKLGISASMKQNKEAIASSLMRIAEELETISAQENNLEILIEYKNRNNAECFLDINKSMAVVNARKSALKIAEERAIEKTRPSIVNECIDNEPVRRPYRQTVTIELDFFDKQTAKEFRAWLDSQNKDKLRYNIITKISY